MVYVYDVYLIQIFSVLFDTITINFFRDILEYLFELWKFFQGTKVEIFQLKKIKKNLDQLKSNGGVT